MSPYAPLTNLGLVWPIAIYWPSLTAPNQTTMEMTAKARTHSCVYELRITLQEIRPRIWRLIQVPSTLRLCCLHDALQAVIS
jgi:hypothetical protein